MTCEFKLRIEVMSREKQVLMMMDRSFNRDVAGGNASLVEFGDADSETAFKSFSKVVTRCPIFQHTHTHQQMDHRLWSRRQNQRLGPLADGVRG